MRHAPPRDGWALPDHLDGPALLFARTAWLLLVGTLAGLVVVGFARAVGDPVPLTVPALAEVFARLRLDLLVMAVIGLLLPWLTMLAVSIVVFWRRSRDPVALWFTLTMLTLYTLFSRTLLYHDGPVSRHALSLVFAAGTLAMSVVLATFPDGRWVPRWSVLLPVATAAVLLWTPDAGRRVMAVMDGRLVPGGREVAFIAVWFATNAAGLVAQRERGRRSGDPVVRQQQRWVVFPLGVGIVYLVTLLLAISSSAVPSATVGWLVLGIVPVGVLVPIAIGNAVLRHRLYDIDRLISRTIGYAVLAVALGAVYGVGVVALGALVAAVSPGDGGQLPVAASTLLVIALFRPARRRVQDVMDRRFYRRHALAVGRLETYAQRLRDPVDVEVVVHELREVVAAAVAPASVTVWSPALDGSDRTASRSSATPASS